MDNYFTVSDCQIIQLKRTNNRAGNIAGVENNIDVSFEVKRIYYLYDVPAGESRGGHAHKQLEQLIIAASGSFDICIDDGRVKRTFQLNRPNIGLHLRPGLWRDLSNFSSGGICLVLASAKYNPEDYIRDYSAYLAFRKNYQFES